MTSDLIEFQEAFGCLTLINSFQKYKPKRMEEAIYLNSDQSIHTNTLILSLSKYLKFVD